MPLHQKPKWHQQKEVSFSFWFLGIFLGSFLVLYFIGLIPTELRVNTGEPTALDRLQQQSLESIAGGDTPTTIPETFIRSNSEVPIRIEASSIGLNFTVVNPSSQNNTVLDGALKQGAVHYPGSGSPGAGNMFIFGHSTSFKVVNNKAYQVFNNLKSLKTGDEIKIITKNGTYYYRVSAVSLEKKTTAYVDFSIEKNMLTLATCNSFGAREDRYVVEADFVGSTVS